MGRKILIIGQALPAVPQKFPYDTTMLYEWLEEVGISKQEAQGIFNFDAVYGYFPGRNPSGGHKKPTQSQMLGYWNSSLREKVNNHHEFWLVGKVAKEFFLSVYTLKKSQSIIYTMHPSGFNRKLYQNNKVCTLNKIKFLLEKYKGGLLCQ